MSLAFYYALLAKKRSDLNRLQICNSKLQAKQEEFVEHQSLMTRPHLTSTTWHGNWARAFSEIRENGVLANFKQIQTTQFSNAFKVISAKIIEIQQEIERIQQIIAALLAEQARSVKK